MFINSRLAFHNYEAKYGSATGRGRKEGSFAVGGRDLPFIEQTAIRKLSSTAVGPSTTKSSRRSRSLYTLPYGKPKENETHYRVFVGGGAAFDMIQGAKFSQFTDGTSNTILVFEAAEGTPWTKPDEIEFDPKQDVMKYFRFETGVCMAAMADGSVRALSKNISEKTLKLLIQRDDGQPID